MTSMTGTSARLSTVDTGSSARTRAFTLTELMTVIAVVAVLGAILFPVLTRAKERGRQTACLSNERQIAAAMLLYLQDNDECFPNGINRNGADRIWPAEGWAGQLMVYIGNTDTFACPDDLTVPPEGLPMVDDVVSYGMNANLVASTSQTGPVPGGFSVSDMAAPPRTVLLFEVARVTSDLSAPAEGAGDRESHGTNFSAAGNGLDNRLYAQRDWTTSIENQYATGYLGGRLPFDPDATQFTAPNGRHFNGANYLLADGHAARLPGSRVSSGRNAGGPACAQDNRPALSGCGMASGTLSAAGTDSGAFAATFSLR